MTDYLRENCKTKTKEIKQTVLKYHRKLKILSVTIKKVLGTAFPEKLIGYVYP